MKGIMKYTLVFVLIFCIKNNNLFPQAEEDWMEINSYIEGEWEGNAISFIRSNFNNTLFESKLNIAMTFNYNKGDAIVLSIVKIDFTDFLTDLENMEEMKEEGYTKETIWKIFKDVLETDFLVFEHYSLFFENTAFADEYFASDSNGRFLMNKNKDMLLLVYYEPAFVLGIGDTGFTKMIF